MRVPIFLNKAVGLRNENATFLHNFSAAYLYIIRKWLTICVFAGLTRKLILVFSNATRCVPTRLTGWDAGSSPAGHEGQKYPLLFHGDCSTKVNLFVEQSAPSQIPDKTEYQAFTRNVPRGTFCALLHKMRKKRQF